MAHIKPMGHIDAVMDASQLISGVLAAARLGTGSPTSSEFLRGDGSWQTIATYLPVLVGVDTTEVTTTSTTTVDLVDITGISIPAANPLMVWWAWRKTTGAVATVQNGLKLNATQSNPDIVVSASEDAARAGHIFMNCMSRNNTSYNLAGGGASTMVGLRVGGNTGSALFDIGNGVAPSVAITSVTVTGLTSSALVTLGANLLHVWRLPVS